MWTRATAPIAAIPGKISKEFGEGTARVKEGLSKDNAGTNVGALDVLSGAMQQIFSPVTGAAEALVGDPLGGATQAATGSKRASDFSRNLGTDVATMVGPGMVTKSLGTVANAMPKFNASVQKLLDKGVQLTPDQIFQSFARSAAKTMKEWPVVGSVISNGHRRSLESFNNAVIDISLGNVGAKLPKGVTGRAAIAAAEDIVGSKYDKLLPKLTFTITPEFRSDLQSIAMKASKLPDAKQKQLQAIADDASVKINNGTMTGRDYKKFESELNFRAREYMGADDPDQRELGRLVNELRGYMADNLERTNPKYAPELKEINTAWAAFTRARDASIRRAGSGGVFSPADLLQTVKGGSTKGSFSRGDALLQDIAEAANDILPAGVPKDMGILGQGLWTGLLTGAYALKPEVAVGAGIAALPFTKPGMRAVNAAVRSSPSATISPALQYGAPIAAVNRAVVDSLEGKNQ